jgi:hypothetical protein
MGATGLPVTVAMKLVLERRRGRAIAELIFGSLASSCLVSRATSPAVSFNPTSGLAAPYHFRYPTMPVVTRMQQAIAAPVNERQDGAANGGKPPPVVDWSRSP